jgi:plasmid stabilization system protein ParE
MTVPISFHEKAEIEINEAADYYDMECPGLGSAFLDEIETAINEIADFPEASPVIRGRIRTKTTVRFPYSLIYSVLPDEIRILAVAHQRRRPFYWQGRG